MEDETKAPDPALDDRQFYPADENLIEMAEECRRQFELANHRLAGAISLYTKQHKLPGYWRVADNGRELERMDRVPPPVAAKVEVPQTKKKKEKTNEQPEQLLGIQSSSGPGGVSENDVSRNGA